MNEEIEELRSQINLNSTRKTEIQVKQNEIMVTKINFKNYLEGLKLYQIYVEKNYRIEENSRQIQNLEAKINEISKNIDIEKFRKINIDK